MSSNLILKYNVPGPRYTSYPTVPYWNNDDFTQKTWIEDTLKSFEQTNSSQGISLYIHLPFCESLCTFCGCNKRITKNHNVETPYLESLIQEWELYLEIFPEKPVIKEIHLGGGTPTFFSPENLAFLLRNIFRKSTIGQNPSFSFEGHPNNTTQEHLKTLFDFGFTRVSYGVQDYNTEVQLAINRLQPFANVKRATVMARDMGYTSIGHDIIFGLPFQKKDHIIHTIEKTKELMPDRIAFYSYAHVPWIKGNGQRGFKGGDLPSAVEKREMYQIGKRMLEEAGYVEIGMDHFALERDPLFKAMEDKILHRNFMGYTESQTQLMIGLGVSAISDSWYSFAQNLKGVEEYQDLLSQGILPIYRGHKLNPEDLKIRQHILNLMCKLETSWSSSQLQFPELPQVLYSLREMESDGLIEIGPEYIKVKESGRPFVRNVCMAFDLLLQRSKPETQLFSMTV